MFSNFKISVDQIKMFPYYSNRILKSPPKGSI